MRSIVLRALRQAGYDSHTFEQAGSGVEALNVIPTYQPDIILSDWNMPEMSGIELLRSLKSSGKDIKFGFVTSEGTADIKQMAQDEGALFFISKPFTPEALQEALQGLVS